MASTGPIRVAQSADAAAIKQLAVAAGLFTGEEVDFLDDPLAGFFAGSLEGHRWIVQEPAESDRLVAAAYYAPEPFADRMFNLYFIAVDPGIQGGGVGRNLLQHIEDELVELGDEHARTLIVETSSTDQYERTREFYRRAGFVEEARIRQFYGPEDDKVVFWKSLV